jgi:transcriptional regulator with XRE-family HTH domain
MDERSAPLYPSSLKILAQVGENITLARKRRHLTLKALSERAMISTVTLWKIEKGDPTVAIGSYIQVLLGLGLQEDFLLLAKDDDFGHLLQDEKLLKRKGQ